MENGKILGALKIHGEYPGFAMPGSRSGGDLAETELKST